MKLLLSVFLASISFNATANAETVENKLTNEGFEELHHDEDDDRRRRRDLIRDGYCDIEFSDNNRNGVGSLEGYCIVEVSRRYYGEHVELKVRGENGEQVGLFAEVDRYGEAYFRLTHRNSRNWRSRHVTARAKFRNDRMSIFRGYVPYEF